MELQWLWWLEMELQWLFFFMLFKRGKRAKFGPLMNGRKEGGEENLVAKRCESWAEW